MSISVSIHLMTDSYLQFNYNINEPFYAKKKVILDQTMIWDVDHRTNISLQTVPIQSLLHLTNFAKLEPNFHLQYSSHMCMQWLNVSRQQNNTHGDISGR